MYYRLLLLSTKLIVYIDTYYEKIFVRLFYRLINVSIKQGIRPAKLQDRVNCLRADQLTEPLTKKLPDFKIKLPASFRTCLVNRSTINCSVQTPERVLDHKPTGQRFSESISVKTPKIFQQSVPLSDLDLIENRVIKPVSGASSRGVYIIFDDSRIYEVSTNTIFHSKDELFKKLEKFVQVNDRNEWISEEYIGNANAEPAHDLKFYSFYGDIGAVLEIKRYPETRYCWWNSEGEMLGKIMNDNKKHFNGNGVSIQDVALAKKVSLEIPAPFVRIDFLRGKNGLYFGEFTPRPGGFANFKKDMDIHLGHCYLEAEARLNNDLINGKSFEAFHNIKI